MADNPIPSLGGKTPLQYAKTPAMDALASAGITGSVRNVPRGLPPGSDTAILSIFGCDPRVCYTGRAPLEAAATGIKLSPGDIAYRCNMVTLEDSDEPFENKKILSHSAGSVDGAVSETLIKEIFTRDEFRKAAESAGLTIHASRSFRHIAVQNSPDTSGGLTLAPPHDHLGEAIADFLPQGGANAGILRNLMKLAHTFLQNHPLNKERRDLGKLPANGIWFWAEGTLVKLPNFTETYGYTGGVISAVPLCRGIAALTGLEIVYVDGATGELDTNYEGKAAAVMDTLEKHDFAAVHIEAPDECTHNGNLDGKIEAIERIDSRIVTPLVKNLRETGYDFKILLLSDHKTLTSSRSHDGEPVPYTLFDSRADMGTKLTHCESDAEKGNYVSAGVDLMGLLFQK